MVQHAFVTARLLPALSSKWLSFQGEKVAEALRTRPFLALRAHQPELLDRAIVSGPHGWHTLFIVSPERPPFPYHDCCLPLTAGDGESPLRLNVPFKSAGPLYLHTFPAILQHPQSSPPLPPLQPGDHQLDDASFDRFLQVLQSTFPPSTRPTGGLDEAKSSWLTFSSGPRFEVRGPEQGHRFEITPFVEGIFHPVSDIWNELILCKQLQKDYSWHRVTFTVAWLEAGLRTVSVSPQPFRPHAEAYQGNVPVLRDASSVSLSNMTIPFDGEPNLSQKEERIEMVDFWGDEGPMPLDGCVDVEPGSTVIPSTAPNVIALDVCDVLFDRSRAVRAAISELGIDIKKGVPRFIELTALVHRSHGGIHVQVVRRALRTLCTEFKVTNLVDSDGRFERAVVKAMRLEVDARAAECLAKLKTLGLTIIGYVSTDALTFREYFQPALQTLSLTILPPSSDASGLFSSCMSRLEEVVAHLKSALPALSLDRVLVVSSSSVRSLEPATALGMATALLQRQDDPEVESLPELYTSPSTMVLSTLSNLPNVVTDPTKWASSNPDTDDPWSIQARVCNIYQLDRELSEGSSVGVYRALNWLANEPVVVKMALPESSKSIVQYEAKVYEQLAGHPALPFVHWVGRYTKNRQYWDEADVLVMDYLGPTLTHLRRVCRGTLTLKSVLMIGIQILDFIEFAHSRGVILRDIKPQNFAVGRAADQASTIYAIDFGLAKMYVEPITGKHIPLRTGRTPCGTPRYASHWAHQGLDASRRDDISVLGHMLLELLHGRLPWRGIYVPSIEAKLIRVGEMKTPGHRAMDEFLARSPKALRDFIAHAWDLEFEQKPDYGLLRALLERELESQYGGYDGLFDWVRPELAPRGTLVPSEYKFIVEPSSRPPSLWP